MNLQEKKGKKKKKNKNKVDSDPLAKSASVGVMPSYMSPVIPRSATTISVAAPSSTSGGSSQTGTGNTSSNSTSSSNAAAAAANSLKSGPQVLIKNINGKVTITPVPGTGTGNAAEMVQQQQTPIVEPIPHKNSSSKQAQQQQKVQTPQSNSSLLQNSSQQQQSQVQGNLLKGIVIWFVRREGIEPIKRVSSLLLQFIYIYIKVVTYIWPTLFVKVEKV